jgi:hypothetical protein
MRRPQKPFVTEYKPSTRRHPSSMGQPQAFADDGESTPPKPFDLGRSDPNARSEDSYEAALRAADALFSTPSPTAKVEPATPTDGAARPDRPGGRILQVIDDTPPEPVFEAEDDAAPKRRGRKPGSKNKPKMPVTSIDPTSVAFRDFNTTESATCHVTQYVSQSPAFVSRDERRVAMVAPEVESDVDAIALSPVASRALPASRTSARSAQPRFAWVRTQLEPGQDWKRRRLPKVCW